MFRNICSNQPCITDIDVATGIQRILSQSCSEDVCITLHKCRIILDVDHCGQCHKQTYCKQAPHNSFKLFWVHTKKHSHNGRNDTSVFPPSGTGAKKDMVCDYCRLLLKQQTGNKQFLSISHAQVWDVLWIWSSPFWVRTLHFIESRSHFAVFVTYS